MLVHREIRVLSNMDIFTYKESVITRMEMGELKIWNLDEWVGVKPLLFFPIFGRHIDQNVGNSVGLSVDKRRVPFHFGHTHCTCRMSSRACWNAASRRGLCSVSSLHVSCFGLGDQCCHRRAICRSWSRLMEKLHYGLSCCDRWPLDFPSVRV